MKFLADLMSLSLGTVINLLTKENMIGSISNVLGSVEKLDANYKSKQTRLSPSVGTTTLNHRAAAFLPFPRRSRFGRLLEKIEAVACGLEEIKIARLLLDGYYPLNHGIVIAC